jgi:hypothetical protein
MVVFYVTYILIKTQIHHCHRRPDADQEASSAGDFR